MRRTAMAVTGGALVLLLAYGPRAAMPYLLPSYLMAAGMERETFGAMLTVQSLVWGVSAILFGVAADRGRARAVLVFSALLYAAGLATLATASSAFAVLLGGGVLAGLGLGGVTFAVVFPALARDGREGENRVAFALATAGAAASALVFVPAVQALLVATDARATLLALAAAVALIAPLALLMPRREAAPAEKSGGGSRSLLVLVVSVLTVGSLAGGFQTGLVSATLGVTLADAGLGVETAVGAVLLLNLFNVFGAASSALPVRRPSPASMLALVFLLRAAAFAAVLALPMSGGLAFGFAALIGLTWLAALPLSVRVATGLSGTRHVGLVTGLMILGWQAGAAGAVAFAVDTYGWWGHYRRGWEISLLFGILMALAHFAIAHASAGRGGAGHSTSG